MVPSWYATEDAPTRGVFFARQAKALMQAGHTVHVLYPDLRVRLRGLQTGVLSAAGGVPGLCGRARAALPFLPPAVRAQRARLLETLYRRAVAQWGAPDVVWLQSCLLGAETAALCRRHRLPLVYLEHYSGVFSPDEALRQTLRKTLAAATAALAVSDALRACMQEMRADVRRVPNCVDTSLFCPAPVPHEGFVFGILCNLVPLKNVDVLLRAFAAAKIENARLRVGGGGPQRARLGRLAHALGIAKQVEFCGVVPPERAPAFYAGCDALVCASRVETFGVTLIEALACGVPVLATRCGGPEDIVRPGQNGLLVQPGDTDELACGLREMTRRTFAPAALRADCEARFGAHAVAERLEEELRRAVAEYAFA